MLEQIEAAYGKGMIDPTEVPSGRRSSPEEQAWPCIFMNSDLAPYINGADLAVDGGFLGYARCRRPTLGLIGAESAFQAAGTAL